MNASTTSAATDSAAPRIGPGAPAAPVLSVEGLTVALADGTTIIDDVSLSMAPGEVLGLVGESGSGKSTLGLALLGYAKPGGSIRSGSVAVAGSDVVRDGRAGPRALRGATIAYVPQDPGTALNPSLRVEQQLREVLRLDIRDGARMREAVARALRQAHLPTDREFLRRYPHQLSGGQQQRLSIAVALSRGPSVVVLDEPTTGLDVITQQAILDEVARLRDETGVSFLYVSHDLSAIAQVADRVAVMYAGHVVESAPTARIVSAPRHPYTRGLVSSVPDHDTPLHLAGIPGLAPGLGRRPSTGCRFVDRCPQAVERCTTEDPALEEVPGSAGETVRCFEWRRTPLAEVRARDVTTPEGGGHLLVVDRLRAEHRGREGTVVAADDVSFDVGVGECVALVGQSGSGKSTIARCIAGLHRPAGGRIALSGVELAGTAKRRSRDQRRRLQIVFQNPYDSLNPRHSVASTIGWSARRLRGLSASDARREVGTLLDLVRLPASLADRYPAELSGGERQRVAIARALAAGPDLVLCDEVTSALDVSVQAAVLDLLLSLRRELGTAMLFITHDLGVVASIADRVVVLQEGRIRETGPVGAVLRSPSDDYTSRLVAAAPRIEGRVLTSEGGS